MLAKHFRLMGVPVHCADREIHSLLKNDPEIQQKIKTLWPDVFVKGRVDRQLLGKQVLCCPAVLGTLEAILYPQLVQRQKEFLLKIKNVKLHLLFLMCHCF